MPQLEAIGIQKWDRGARVEGTHPATSGCCNCGSYRKSRRPKPMPAMTFWPEPRKISAWSQNPPDTMSDTQALAITEEPIGIRSRQPADVVAESARSPCCRSCSATPDAFFGARRLPRSARFSPPFSR